MSASPELLPAVLKMLVALAVVVGGLFLLFYFSRRLSGHHSGRMEHQLIRVLATSCIGVKKSISVVEVAGQILVVGVTGEQINLLSTIEDPTVIDCIRKRPNQKSPVAFGQQLKYFASKFKGIQGAESTK